MLKIIIPGTETFNDATQLFNTTSDKELQLEHSLVSVSKWEAKWEKRFLDKQERTTEEVIDYVKCMTLTQNVDQELYNNLTNHNIEQIKRYIDAPMTATVFYDDKRSKGSNEKVSSELIYYWMISFNIPFECQKWHFNRLLTLIRVCNVKNQPKKKRSKREILSRNAELNASRLKQLNTKG